MSATPSIQALLPEQDADHSLSGKPRADGSPSVTSPIIGIPFPVQQAAHGLALEADAMSVWAMQTLSAGVLLIPLWPLPPHPHRFCSLWPVLSSIDGLLLPAHPHAPHWSVCWHTPDPGEQASDSQGWSLAWEIACAQLASSIGMPLLALGEGAQLWHVALGGHLGPLPFPAEHPPITPDAWPQSMIRVRASSQIAGALHSYLAQQDMASVSQRWELPCPASPSLEPLVEGVRACLQTETGVMVGFERMDACFGLGILARIDWGLEHPYSKVVLEQFLQACRTFAALRVHTDRETSAEALCVQIAARVEQGQSLLIPPLSIPSAPPSPPASHRFPLPSLHLFCQER
jgi:gamma-glutamyl-gamma-aminobutyrate hydrolase PuuD